MTSQGIVFYGTLIHAPSPSTFTILQNTILATSPSGTITHLIPSIPPSSLPSALSSNSLSQLPLKQLSPSQFLIPGFIDTHNHAPQWAQRGLGQGMHILDWLSEITFPNEAKFADTQHARRVYEDLVRGMLRQGITTASYYGSLHGNASRVLADICLEKGQRALVGKCNMDQNSPDIYRETSAEESLRETRACIKHIHSIDGKGDLIRPVLTPRFAISCTEQLLSGLGAIAKQNPTMAIQTHFNEAQQEIDFTRSLFPSFSSEADLYSHFNLLGPTSILAHCTIMTEYEMDVLGREKCGVAHCPTANMTVGGGFMAAPIKKFMRRGVKVGLGTDSGGGYSSSMLTSMRHALIASFAKDASTQSPEGLSLEEVFFLATQGGADVVGFGNEVGHFAMGKHFDAMVVDMSDERKGVNTPLQVGDGVRTVFDKFVMTGDDRNIVDVYVRGRLVHSS